MSKAEVAAFSLNDTELKLSIERFIKYVYSSNNNGNIQLYVVDECASDDIIKKLWNEFNSLNTIPPVLFIALADSGTHGVIEFLKSGLYTWQIWNPRKSSLGSVLKYLINKDEQKKGEFLKSIEEKFIKIKAWFEKGVFKENDLFDFLQNVYKGENLKRSREVLGHEGEFTENIRLQIWDLLQAIWLRNDKPLNILVIENNPGKRLVQIDKRFEEVLSNTNRNLPLVDVLTKTFEHVGNSAVYIYTKDFTDLYSQLVRAKQGKVNKIKIECKIAGGSNESLISIDLFSMDLIFVDIFLNSDVNGVDFVNVLREVVPRIPTFILSISNDFRVIQQAFGRGADFYIMKNQLFSVPFLYDTYINEIGELIKFINDKTLQKSLLGNIRYWRYKKNYLSFGDKCFHMIDHSYDHIADNWETTNKLLVPLLRTNFLQAEYKFGDKKITRDELIYAFSMAIWLHDIGHKGTHRYGEPHMIRETHGIISGEILISLPESFGIATREHDSIYKGLVFPVGAEKKPVTQLILEAATKEKTLTILEMISLFSIYHKSNSPLTEKEYYEMIDKGKFIPTDFFENCQYGKPIIHLHRILEKLDNSDFNKDFLSLVALFRFIDALDIRVSRVGDPKEETMKKWVIKNDLKYNLGRLKNLVERLSERYSNDPLEKASFVKNFLLDVQSKIYNQESIQINALASQLSQFKEWEEYRVLLSFCYFIGAQEGHFDLHSSISKIDIENKGGRNFKVTLWTEKDADNLKEKKIFEVGKETETIFDRLIGKNCYIFRELNSGKEDLSNIFDQVTIESRSLVDMKPIEKPIIWPQR